MLRWNVLCFVISDASEDGVLVVVDDVLKIAQPFSDFERLTYRLVCDVTYKEQNFKVDEHGSVYVREANHGRPRVISKSKIYVKVTEV